MYDDAPKISFGDLKIELKGLIWPNGVPENLIAPIDKSFEDAFMDIQTYVKCLQGWHTDVFAQCATYFQCGLTVLDKPRGMIRRIRTFQGNFCDPVTLTPATMAEVRCWSRRFMERVDAPANVGMPVLPMGFRFADASTDSSFGRALVGIYSFDRDRIYVAPWIQSLESIVIEWDGLKTKFADTDLLPDDQGLKRAMRLYAQKEFGRDFERDFTGKKVFETDWIDARADLIYTCEQEMRLPQAESCGAEREYLWAHQTEDDNPDTAEKPTVIALIGDYGNASTDERDVAALIKSWTPAGVVTLGDNNYQDSAPLTYDEAVGAYYRKFIFPYAGAEPLWTGETAATANQFWPCLGNHDNDHLADYLAYFAALTPGNDRFYDVVIGPVHFFIVNSGIKTDGTVIETAGNESLSVQAAWFRSRVATSLARWKVAVVHHPPYASLGTHASTTVLQWVKGVDLVISGHNHHYERLLEDGQIYLIAGAGGAALYPFTGSPIAGSQLRYAEDFGALKMSATCAELKAEFINASGEVIDTVTLT